MPKKKPKRRVYKSPPSPRVKAVMDLGYSRAEAIRIVKVFKLRRGGKR